VLVLYDFSAHDNAPGSSSLMLSCSFVVVHALILGNIILLRGRLERVCAIIKGRLKEMENGKSLACTRMYIKTFVFHGSDIFGYTRE